MLKAGETFYEPAGCLHRVSKNPGKVKTRVLAWVLHPRDAKDIVIPGPRSKPAPGDAAMNVFVAGASGAIGRPLVAELVRRGHAVTGMTRSDAGARALADLGAAVARVSAFDAPALEQALRESRAEVVIDELTALPRSPAEMAAAAEGDRKLRLEGGGNLHRAAPACGVRRYVQQASGFFLRPGRGLGDESEGLAVDASPRVAAERPHLRRAGGAGCWTPGTSRASPCGTGSSTGRAPGTTRTGRPPTRCGGSEVPIIGEGEGVWSWVHIDDAAVATVDALDGPARGVPRRR